MKKLESLTIDGHTVEIEAHRETDGIKFVAKCGEITREGKMTMHVNPELERTPEQHVKDVQEFTQILARECVEHHKKEKILDDFFKEE